MISIDRRALVTVETRSVGAEVMCQVVKDMRVREKERRVRK